VKKQYLTILFLSVLALGLGALAQEVDTVVVNIPYEFVARGATLPAGTYKISRADTLALRELILTNYDTGKATYLVPTLYESAPAEHVKLSLESIGGKYFLNKIQTANGVYTIATPASATKLAQVHEDHARSASGSN